MAISLSELEDMSKDDLTMYMLEIMDRYETRRFNAYLISLKL